MNLIVHYGSAGYLAAKMEIHAILTKLGDQKEEQDLLAPGVIGVTTKLDARKIVVDVKDHYVSDPESIRATYKWEPADNWCDAATDAITKIIREDIREFMMPDDLYTIEVDEHNSKLAKDEVIKAAAKYMRGKLDHERPNKTLVIELFDTKACVTLALKKEMFTK